MWNQPRCSRFPNCDVACDNGNGQAPPNFPASHLPAVTLTRLSMAIAITQLANQLQQLSDTLKATNTLISRLANLTFRPGSEPLDSKNTVSAELSQDIHDSLKQLEEDLELVSQEAEDLTVVTGNSAGSGIRRRESSERQRESARLSAQVARLGEDLRQSRGAFRRAQVSAKKASETAKRKERELLFASLQQDATANGELDVSGNSSSGTLTKSDLFAGRGKRLQQQQKHLSKDELEAQATSDVTSALRRTQTLLSTEVERSRFAQEAFDESTAALASLGETYTDIGSVVNKSRELLGTLLRSQKSDTWYLETAFYLLLATLTWLVFRRLIFGPFVKLPLFLFRIAVFLLNWLLLKPVWLFLTLTGVITTTEVSGYNAPGKALTSSSRTPLIIQPSAKGGVPKLPMQDRTGMMREGAGIPVGGGGAGAKVGKDADAERRMIDRIGQMHERSEGETKGGYGSKRDGEPVEEPVKRGDGTVLNERREKDEPRNPKKKMFEADVEDAKQAQATEERESRQEL